MRCDREQVISSLNPFRLVIYRRQRARLRSYFGRTRRVSLSYFGVHASPYLLPLLVRTVTHDSSCVTPTALLPLRLVSSPLLSLHSDVFCFPALGNEPRVVSQILGGPRVETAGGSFGASGLG